MSVPQRKNCGGMQNKHNNTYMEDITMEEISVKRTDVIKFRVAELLRKVAKFVKSFNYRMEAIK